MSGRVVATNSSVMAVRKVVSVTVPLSATRRQRDLSDQNK